MIVRAGMATSFLIEFPSGHPDGNISWRLLAPLGVVLTTGTITPDATAVSSNLQIASGFNSLSNGALNTYRDVEWTYSVGGSVVNGEARYIIEARVPYGASTSGVRTKLGIDNAVDLPDNEISLVSAYKNFTANLSAPLLAAVDPADYRLRDAVEATAALALIPSLSVRLAKKEDSGTSSFQRDTIDWGRLTDSLTATVLTGLIVVNPAYNPLGDAGALFLVVTPATDAFTGVAAT